MLWAAVFAACALGTAETAEAALEPPLPSPSTWRVVIAAKFTLPQVTAPIPGSKEAVFAAAWVTAAKERMVCPMDQNAFDALGLDWKAFSAKAASAASAELAALAKPELIRDRREVLECAILRSRYLPDDITAVVLSPDFLPLFAPLFGSKLLVAIPDRHTIFLFPKLASRYPNYASRMLAIYRKSECPVSREVFELSADGLRAIGTYEEP